MFIIGGGRLAIYALRNVDAKGDHVTSMTSDRTSQSKVRDLREES